MFLLPLIQLAAVLYVTISLTSQRLEVLRQIKCMRSRDSPETSIYLFIYYLFIIYLSFCKLVQNVFYQVFMFFFLHGFVIQVLSSSPFLPTLRLSSDGDTDRKRASDKTSRSGDDFIVVSNTHRDNYKVFLVIITEAPYNRMFANEKPASQMVFSMPYRSLFD